MTDRVTRTALAVLVMATPVLAHDGHGETDGASPLHYVVEPLHVATLALGAVVGVGLSVVLYRLAKGGRRRGAQDVNSGIE